MHTSLCRCIARAIAVTMDEITEPSFNFLTILWVNFIQPTTHLPQYPLPPFRFQQPFQGRCRLFFNFVAFNRVLVTFCGREKTVVTCKSYQHKLGSLQTTLKVTALVAHHQ